MRIAALIGEPATGKSTLARALVAELSMGFPFKKGLVTGTRHEKDRVLVLGTYENGERFPGTDRLSMAVQPQAEGFLANPVFSEWSVFFEGDRLGNRKFFNFLQVIGELRVFALMSSDPEKSRRHVSRADSQSPTFLKGRRTKVERLAAEFDCLPLRSEVLADIRVNSATLRAFLLPGR